MGKYQDKDKADLDSGKTLKYHTPAIKKAMSHDKALKKAKRVDTDHEDFTKKMKSKYPNYRPQN